MKRNFARVVVYVEDCNDHSPTFLSPRYEANVSSQVAAGSQVLTVKALDQDVGSNAEITYSILTGEHQQTLPSARCCCSFTTEAPFILRWTQQDIADHV